MACNKALIQSGGTAWSTLWSLQHVPLLSYCKKKCFTHKLVSHWKLIDHKAPLDSQTLSKIGPSFPKQFRRLQKRKLSNTFLFLLYRRNKLYKFIAARHYCIRTTPIRLFDQGDSFSFHSSSNSQYFSCADSHRLMKFLTFSSPASRAKAEPHFPLLPARDSLFFRCTLFP